MRIAHHDCMSGVAVTMCVLHACRSCQPTMCCAACVLQLSVPLSYVLPSLLHRLAPTLSQPTVRHSHDPTQDDPLSRAAE